MTAIVYLKSQLNDTGDFLKSYKGLSTKDKEDLKTWAVEEMEVLGIEAE